MNALEKLRSVVDELKANAKPTQTQPNWDLAGRLASRFPVDAVRLKNALAAKDLAELDAIVAALERPAAAVAAGPVIDKGTLDAAFHAFKKRLKLMRLADESKLGGRLMTGGKKSEIDAIIPPSEFPAEVWKALEADGRLRHTGQGFYAEA